MSAVKNKKVSEFIENWGQSHEELCFNLGLDEDTSDDVIMLDYFWHGESSKWFLKSNSLHTKEEEHISKQIREA